MLRFRSTTASISLLALALAGCNKSAQDMSAATATPGASPSPDSGLPALPAALPMQTGPATPLATAPPVAALPVRRYVNVARPARDRDAYAYLDRASDVQDEIGDAPPDYDYRNDDGATPYVWQTSGGDYRYAERGPDGYRYYYYQPGARQPYLVRTHDYSYAYAAGALVAVFALSGALLSHDHYDSYRDDASRYYWRGDHLRQSGDERRHEGVIAADWSQQRPQFSAERENWAAARQRQPDWQAYHAQNDPSRQPGWQQEHQQRQQVAQQFSGWQQRGLQGPPPPALAARAPRPYDGQRAAYGAGAGHDTGRPQGGYGPGGQNPTAAQETAARDQQLAAQQEARHQDQANQQRTQQANQQHEQQAKDAQHEADSRQQLANRAQHQQDVAAQQVRAREAQQRDVQQREAQQRDMQQRNARQHEMQQREAQQRDVQHHELQQRETQQREAQASTRQAQMRDLAAQRQAETARAQESRVQVQEHAQQAAAAHEHAAQAQRPSQERPPAPHPEAPHPEHHEPGHGEPGHENDHHN